MSGANPLLLQPAFGIYFLTYHTVKGWFRQRLASSQAPATVDTSQAWSHSRPDDPTIGVIGAPSAADTYGAHQSSHLHSHGAKAAAPSASDGEGTPSATDNVALGTVPLLVRHVAMTAVPFSPDRTSALQLAGGLAGTMSWLVLHPIDVCKSLYQSRDISLPAHERELMPVLRHYYKSEGIK